MANKTVNCSFFRATGQLEYSTDNTGFKLICSVPEEIVLYYRKLLPKYLYVRPQLYKPHISVIRWETPRNLEFWGKHEGETVEFEYSNYVFNDALYYWLDVRCKRFKEIRKELDLPKYRVGKTCYHCTIGNTK